MNEETGREILEQIRKSNRMAWVLIAILIVFVCSSTTIRIFTCPDSGDSSRSGPSWSEVSSLMEAAEYDKAMTTTRALIEKSPDYFYGYSYLGGIYLAKGDFAKAEENYAKAYELFPTEQNEKSLSAVRKVLKSRQAEQRSGNDSQ